MCTLSVVIVSTNDAVWLRPCLESVYAHAGGLELDLVVADNESTDETAALVGEEFPAARVVRCENRGFGHANNRAALTCSSPYILFLNPDTEILTGRLSDLVAFLDGRPEIGLLSVRQLTADGIVFPTIRRFPNALRALGECIGSERLPGALSRLGPRILDRAVYERETEADWLTGAFMVLRAETLQGAGLFDERFFMSSEEVDLALRVRHAGWKVVHSPAMTILHHVHMGQPLSDRMEAQYAYSKLLYARKHFRGVHRRVYLTLVACRHRLRLLRTHLPGTSRFSPGADRWALAVLNGSVPPPFGPPPQTAVAPASRGERSPIPTTLV